MTLAHIVVETFALGLALAGVLGTALQHKAGLAGRAEMAAFFLEDLLLPRTPESAARRSPASG